MSESDLRHAISMRPHPFHKHQHDLHSGHSSRDQSPAHLPPTSPDSSTRAKHSARKSAHTTAFEAESPDEDPVARHVADVEDHAQPHYTSETDPFALSSKKVDIDQFKANSSRKRQDSVNGAKLPLYRAGKDKWQAKKLQGFYEEQNENIERLLKPVDGHRQEAKQLEGETNLRYKIAVVGSFVANLILAGLQLYAAISSKSLSLFTTMADALFDPLSNVMLMLTNRATGRVDPRTYPSGKARIETAGNIFFCFAMTAVSLIIIVQSVEDLVNGSKNWTGVKPLYTASLAAVGTAFCVKLALFFYCWALRDIYSQIRILWEDHRNDLIINGLGLATSLMGTKVRWWIDPAGAIFLSSIIIFLWMRTAVSEFKLLIGVTAETSMLQLITYICMYLQWSNGTPLTCISHDPLFLHHANRHRASVLFGSPSDCRSRCCHGSLRVPQVHPRYCGGLTDQA